MWDVAPKVMTGLDYARAAKFPADASRLNNRPRIPGLDFWVRQRVLLTGYRYVRMLWSRHS